MSFKNDDASFTVDKSTLADGVSQISVFDEAKQPVCERLYFKKPAHSLQLALSADKNSYTKRKSKPATAVAGDGRCSGFGRPVRFGLPY